MEQSPQLLLASASPRRAALLQQLGLRFRVEVADIDETIAEESPQQAVERIARDKAQHVWSRCRQQGLPVLAADTVVVHRGAILQKPASREAGLEMLARLSGESHQVMSGVALVSAAGCETVVSCSEVTFRDISAAEREAYWNSGEPLDKAGGYAIQGVAALFVAHLQGSYSGVVGLPLFETAQLLQQAGVKVL
jgi:septum formation protein